MNRRQAIATGLGAGLAACSTGRAAKRPNVLFVMTDDHATSALGCYGNPLVRTPVLDRLASEGVRFTNAFCTNSLCAPGRAATITGTYSHRNRILGNSEMKGQEEHLDQSLPTFPRILQANGYRTALVGKWHMSDDPRGFDYWCVLPGQGVYFDPELIENGQRKKFTGYASDVTTDLALRFLEQAGSDRAGDGKPWCLVYQHKAPHRPFLPPPRHAKLYDGVELPYPATFDDDYATRKVAAAAEDMRFDLSLEPDYKKEIPKGLSAAAKKRWIYQRFVKDYYGAIAGVDDNLGRVLDHLRKTNQYDNTLVVYTTDNGFFVGEHGWYDKRFMYEPSLRIPLLVRPPGGIPSGRTTEAFALNIDYASTILDYTACPIPAEMQGRSLRPVLESPTPPADWPTSIYYAYYENSWALAGKGKEAMSDPSFAFFTPHRIGPHRGVRTRTHKLIHYYSEGEYWELFDLVQDPNELNNLYGDPAVGALTGELKAEMTRLRRQYSDHA